MFTQEELKNLSILINKATITGAEAITVALLQQKIAQLIKPVEPKSTEPTEEPKKEDKNKAK